MRAGDIGTITSNAQAHSRPGGVLELLSLGAGIQSSALAIASANGKIDPPLDACVFADTGSENPLTYEWLDWLEAWLSSKGLPVYRTSRDDAALHEHVLNRLGDRRMENPPFWTRDSGGKGNSPLMQKCTRAYKARPIEGKMRELAGFQKGATIPDGMLCVVQSRGISVDEAHRMKPATAKWMRTRYPLIEELRWTRQDCEAYVLAETGKRPPKSACWMCPHTHPSRWVTMEREQPELFVLAEAFDGAIRDGVPGCDGRAFMHRYRMPLRDAVDLDHSQGNLFDADPGFGDECEGHCGV